MIKLLKPITNVVHGCFWTAGEHAGHVVRQILTIRCLAAKSAGPQRLDVEGIERIDIEASSHPTWKAFARGLNKEDKMLLDVWRCGAVKT